MGRSVHILGAGGIGVALGCALLQNGVDVTMVDANPAKLCAGRQDGLSVDGRRSAGAKFVEFSAWQPPADAWLLLCTKTYDNAAVLDRLPDARNLVPVQNGFDPELDRREHASEGIASFVSECERDAPVTRITRAGDLHIGGRHAAAAAGDRASGDKASGDIASLAAALSGTRLFRVRLVEDVTPYKTAKLMYNAAISPLAAAAGVDNAELLTDPLASRLFFALLQENHRILRDSGARFARIGPFHPDTVARILRTPGLPRLMAVFFRPSLRNTYCSMAPDMASGRTEIEAYNGHLIRLAGNQPCALNRAAHALVAEIAAGRLQTGKANLRRIADSVA